MAGLSRLLNDPSMQAFLNQRDNAERTVGDLIVIVSATRSRGRNSTRLTSRPSVGSTLTLGSPSAYRARSCDDSESQTRTVKSPEPETSRVPSGLQATAWT